MDKFVQSAQNEILNQLRDLKYKINNCLENGDYKRAVEHCIKLIEYRDIFGKKSLANEIIE